MPGTIVRSVAGAAAMAATICGVAVVWLGFQASDRAAAVTAGPGSATIAYSLPSTETPDPATGTDLIDWAASSNPEGLRVKAWGSIRQAESIAVLVPGVGHRAVEFERDDATLSPQEPAMTLPERARALLAASDDQGLAVIGWLGYSPPADATQALTTGAGPIRTGAANLVALNAFLTEVNPGASITWICHSYGSLICASALHHDTAPADPPTTAHPTAVALIGSPGIEAESAADLPTSAQIWAGRGSNDFIEWAGALNLFGAGFGADPTDARFGAQRIPCEPGSGHSDYFQANTVQLHALAAIAQRNEL